MFLFRFATSGGELMVSGRFATELAGRKARPKGWDGLAEEMNKAGLDLARNLFHRMTPASWYSCLQFNPQSG